MHRQSRLPDNELREAIMDKNPGRLAIAGFIHDKDQMVYLTMADGSFVSEALSYFEPNARCTPDFRRFAIGDCGQTLVFGEYEASIDALLRHQKRVRL